MADTVLVEEMDGPTAPEADVRARWIVKRAVAEELFPHRPPIALDAFVTQTRAVMPNDVDLRWMVWDEHRANPVAIAALDYTTGPTNQHLAFADISILPEHRRQGLGTRLLRLLAFKAESLGRTTMIIDAPAHGVADRFLAERGFEVKLTARVSRMPMAEVDRSMLKGWVAAAQERARGYSLLWLAEPVPDDLVDEYVRIGMVMNTAPRDDLDMEDWVDTTEEFRARSDQQRAQGWVPWRLVARHDETGSFVGYTNVHFAPWTPGIAHQGGTAVDPAHRNLGLGRWLKAAMALRILDERPDITSVDTDNAESNDAMLAINVAMGFRELHVEQAWQARVEDVLKRLG